MKIKHLLLWGISNLPYFVFGLIFFPAAALLKCSRKQVRTANRCVPQRSEEHTETGRARGTHRLYAKFRKRVFRVCLCGIILCAALTTSSAQENITFNINRKKDMLPFFKVEAVTGNQRILLWDSHDATSKWLMILDGKRFNFKNTNWRPIQRINDQTYIIPYNDQDFSIEQRLEFSSDFRRGAIIFRFSSNFMHTVQPVLLLDTYLGEDANAPFRVGDSGVILEETEFIEKNIPQKIMSGSYEVPLTLELYSANSVSPARVVLANYVRLNARPYNYTINTGKNFETLYHGNNDSAILLEFFETVVMPGESKDFIISFSFEGVNSESMAALAPAPEYPVDQERVSLLHSYLDAIKAIINNIDTLQAEPPGINETSVSGIESQVLEQERLRTEYENLQ